MRHYTRDEWIAGATLEDGIYWREADGEDVTISLEAGCKCTQYGLRGSASGSIAVTGPGDGGAYRTGSGNGIAYRGGSGNGDAHRTGSGNGFAYRLDDGNGNAYGN